MRILQVVHNSPFYHQAGTEIYTHDLSLELSRRHQIYIFCRTNNIKQKDYEITKRSFGEITVYLINNTFKHCNSFEMYYENNVIDLRAESFLYPIELLPLAAFIIILSEWSVEASFTKIIS